MVTLFARPASARSVVADHGRVSVKKCLQFGQVQGSQPLEVPRYGKHLYEYAVFADFMTALNLDNVVVDKTLHHRRHGASARKLSTDAGQSSPHFDVRSFSPNPTARGPIFSRAGLIGRYNLALGHFADRGDLIRCLQIAAQMKAQAIKPDVLAYNCLIRACGKDALSKQAIAIFEDMLAVGLYPERETFHLLLKVSPPVQINYEYSLIPG